MMRLRGKDDRCDNEHLLSRCLTHWQWCTEVHAGLYSDACVEMHLILFCNNFYTQTISVFKVYKVVLSGNHKLLFILCLGVEW